MLATVSKFVPFTVTVAPDATVPGVKFEIVGAPPAEETTIAFLVADPVGDVTPIVYEPSVSPAGTVVINCVALADVTVPFVPVLPFGRGPAYNVTAALIKLDGALPRTPARRSRGPLRPAPLLAGAPCAPRPLMRLGHRNEYKVRFWSRISG